MASAIAQRLAEFSFDTNYTDIPDEVLQFCKSLTLKTIGGMVAGSVHPSAKKMLGLIKARGLSQEIGIVHGGFKTSLWDAIFLNSFFAHVQELEDDRIGGGVSWDITVIPLLISLAEKQNLSGKALLVAIATGLEVHTRTCLFSAEHVGLTVVPGAVGPAAAAAKGLGLSAQETAMAMGLALSSANLSLTNFGTDTHFLESSLHSLQAIMAAEMAQIGMTSNPDLGAYLSQLLGKGRVNEEDFVQDLGKRWLLTEIMIKKYPCCFMVHRQVDSLLQLRKEHNLAYQDVAAIEVYGSPGDRFCDRGDPKTDGDLQFSFQHALGAAMLEGDLTLEHFTVSAISDPKLSEARSKVSVMIDPSLSKLVMVEPGRIAVVMKDGRKFPAERMHPIGSIQEPLSVDGIRAVYRKFVKGLLADDEIERVADAVLNLEQLDDVHGLMKILV